MSLSFLYWIDNRTILGCLILLTATFAFVFLGLSRMHPNMRGARDFSLSYLFALVGCGLISMRGRIPCLISVVVGNTLIFAAFALIYRGILHFFHRSRSLFPLCVVIAVAAIPLTWFSQVHDNIVPRIVVISLVYALFRALIAIELFRNADGRHVIVLFGCFMSLYVVSSIHRAIFTGIHGAPQDFMDHNTLQSGLLIVETVFVCIMAIFKLLMLYSDLLSRVEDQSHQDSVSGALNRRGIEAKLAVELKRIERSRQKLSVAFIDIDYFKTINDTAGHAAGDNALRAVASTISAQLRAYDFLGRFGGDEFLLILPQTSSADAVLVAERIGKAVRASTSLSGNHELTLSLGLSEAVPGEESPSLLDRADKALYDAKHAGRNCTRVVLPAPLEIVAMHPPAPINTLLTQEAGLIQS